MSKNAKHLPILKQAKLTFGQLVSAICQTGHYFSSQANRAVNVSLTLRNWVIGFYIREYEQNGEDRAKYGEKLFVQLSQKLKKTGALQYDFRELRRCRTFYEVYPQIRGTVSPESGLILPYEIKHTLS